MSCSSCPAENMALYAREIVESNPEHVLNYSERQALLQRLIIRQGLIHAIMEEECSGMTEEDLQCPQLQLIDGAYENIFPAGESTTNTLNQCDTDNN